MDARSERVSNIRAELDEVGVDEFCRRRYEAEGMPVKLMRKMQAARLVPEYRVDIEARGARRVTVARVDALMLVAQGYENDEAAKARDISPTAMRDRRKTAIRMLGAHNACHAVWIGHERGLLHGVGPGKERNVKNYSGAATWTPARVEAMRLRADGLQIEEIGAKMGRTENAARDLMRAGLALLGAVNGPNSVHRAILAGVL